MTAHQKIPSVLKDAIRTVAIEQNFDENCEIKTELVESNDVLSSAYKVGIFNKEKTLFLFVKCLESGSNNTFLPESITYFRNEVVFYEELLPAFLELTKQNPSPENHQKAISTHQINPRTPEKRYLLPTKIPTNFCPRCFKTKFSQEISYIIMEDLLNQGYLSPDRRKPLELPSAELLMDQLGKLHGLSFVLKEKHPLKFYNIVERIEETLFAEKMKPTFGKLFIHAIHDALKLVRHSLPPNSIYVDRLSEFALNIFDKMSFLAKGDIEDEPYKVVTHGDVWNNNLLFHYEEENKPSSVCLLDYQACRYASPAHDVSFMLLVSLSKETREENREKLIRRYHSELCRTIQDLGSDPLRLFPYSALQMQLAKHYKFAVGLALVGLPLYLDEGDGTLEERMTSDGSDKEEENIAEDSKIDANAVVQSVQKISARKSMKCKNKIIEVVMDAVDQGLL